jgi:lycopene cyclase domain-containing protein
MTDRWQYLIVLGLCLAVTVPLEFLGAGVYRQPWRLMRAVVPVALVFLAWDAVAIVAGVWTYNGDYISGIHLPFRLPVEEALFFVVIPVCALLTYNAVTTILDRRKHR